MFNLSLQAANDLFGWFNIALIGGAAFVLIGTVGTIWTGTVRDRYSDERIADNEAKTAHANADAATAQLRSKELEISLESERIERLKLEQQTQPRQLTGRQQEILTAGIHAAGWKDAEIIWHGAGEPEIYARSLAAAFENAGARVSVHTLGPFIPEAWGLSAETNDTIGAKDHPTLFVGIREDVGTPQQSR